MLYDLNDYFAFARLTGTTSHGAGVVIASTFSVPGTYRQTFYAGRLSLGATKVAYSGGSASADDPTSIGWERSYGNTIPSATTLDHYFQDYDDVELGTTPPFPGLNLHPTEIDPGTHDISRSNTVVGQVDVYEYAIGTRILTVEHWWLQQAAGSPLLAQNGTMDILYSSATPTGGSADTPVANGRTWHELIVVVVL